MAKQAKLDISKYSPKELEKLNKMLSKGGSSIAAITGKSASSNPAAYRQKCLELHAKFEELARKEGVTLAHIFTATDKPVKTYKHPETGQKHSGRGKKPAYREGSKGTWPSLMATPEEAPED